MCLVVEPGFHRPERRPTIFVGLAYENSIFCSKSPFYADPYMLSSNILLFDSWTQDILGKIVKEMPLPEFSF